ncbi:putative chromatin remodeling & transcription regulator BTB-POZ family [Helianthus annuus]|nr:putative chromatin remodeling & transcription regulator BTB-POZ family [Helianthus annuus]
MLRFSQSSLLSTVFSQNHHKFHKHNNHSSTNIVTIDVGSQIFQTTKQTLTLASFNVLFSNIFNSYDQNNQIPFVDRDPDHFSILLSVLRTGNLPSKAKLFDIQDIIFKAQYYGIDHLLILNLGGRDCVSVVDVTSNGPVLVSHGSKITSFDWALQRMSTVLTRFAAIDSLLSLSSNVVAAGATDFSRLQIIDLDKGLLMQSLNWENLTKSSSTVQAIMKSPEFLFTSFESGRRNSNSIMVYGVTDGFRTVYEITRNKILKKCHIDRYILKQIHDYAFLEKISKLRN